MTISARLRFLILGATALTMAMTAGAAFAAVTENPPPAGPENTYEAQNGAFGWFCGVKRTAVEPQPSGWYTHGNTRSKYSPSGFCNANLPLDAGLINSEAYIQRNDLTMCTGYYFGTNPDDYWQAAAYGVLCGGPATGTKRASTVHDLTLYSYAGLEFWTSPWVTA